MNRIFLTYVCTSGRGQNYLSKLYTLDNNYSNKDYEFTSINY